MSDKIMRMRARPKILLCGSYEEAWDAFNRFQDDVLGVISDIEFPARRRAVARPPASSSRAGSAPAGPTCRSCSSRRTRPTPRPRPSVGATFLLKGSPTLLADLRQFMIDYFGFGDFVFRRPTARWSAWRTTSSRWRSGSGPRRPTASRYHAARNHFSSWLKARTEFALADELRPRKVSDFPDPESAAQLPDRDHRALPPRPQPGRGRRLRPHRVRPAPRLPPDRRRLARRQGARPGVRAHAARPDSRSPTGFDARGQRAVGGGAGDRRVRPVPRGQRPARLRAAQHATTPSSARRFLAARFPADVRDDLAALLPRIDYPLAVRSSSLLEDSQYQPFAGDLRHVHAGQRRRRRRGAARRPDPRDRPGLRLDVLAPRQGLHRARPRTGWRRRRWR